MKNRHIWVQLIYLLVVVVVIMLGFSQVLPLPVQILAAVVLLGIPFVREFLPRQSVSPFHLGDFPPNRPIRFKSKR